MNIPLKFLFTASFADGHAIEQDAADVSSLDPLKSQFYDVLQYEQASPLVRFELSDGITRYAVDLIDGHFEVNGLSFSMNEREDLSDFRIIFYRQHRHEFDVGKDRNEELSHDVTYCLGWQTVLVGKNYQEIMRIN